jgi:hypothetical protein
MTDEIFNCSPFFIDSFSLLNRVQQLAKKMGEELASYGDSVTKRAQLQEVIEMW